MDLLNPSRASLVPDLPDQEQRPPLSPPHLSPCCPPVPNLPGQAEHPPVPDLHGQAEHPPGPAGPPHCPHPGSRHHHGCPGGRLLGDLIRSVDQTSVLP